jgi:hypothetical protein
MGTREIRQAQAWLVGSDKLKKRGRSEGLMEVGRAGYMGKRAAEDELFVGNMSSIQRADSDFYAKRRTTSHDNRTRTNNSQSSV